MRFDSSMQTDAAEADAAGQLLLTLLSQLFLHVLECVSTPAPPAK